MTFIVLDLETSGLEPQWNQPLQAALIYCDEQLRPLSELSLRCRLPAHIVPAPGALLTTGIGPAQLEQAPLTSTEMLSTIAKALAAWAPATVIGYNSLRFDEEMLRHAFFTHLLPPYATQLGGHCRADLLTMVRAVSMLDPSALTVPIGKTGKVSHKLGDICRANGIALSEDEAHDALADTRATLALLRHLRAAAPSVVAMMLANSDKAVPGRMLAGGDVLLLGATSKLTPVIGVTPNPKVATSWATVDLSIDPASYLDGSTEEVASLLSGSGPRPVKLVRTNAQPILMAYAQGCHALPPEHRDEALYNERAARIRDHAGFRANLAAALANRFADREPSPFPEATLYTGGFISNDDARLSARWHASPWEDRAAIAAQFKDERLRAFSNRLTLLESPQAMAPAAWQKGQAWLRERLTTEADVPWLTLPRALREVAELRGSLDDADIGRRAHLDAIEHWLRQRSQFFQLAA